MARSRLDLDVASTDQVAKVLRAAADRFYSDASELDSAWQARSAGGPWRKIAKILEGAAAKIDREVG
jgi:hypothetical protein